MSEQGWVSSPNSITVPFRFCWHSFRRRRWMHYQRRNSLKKELLLLPCNRPTCFSQWHFDQQEVKTKIIWFLWWSDPPVIRNNSAEMAAHPCWSLPLIIHHHRYQTSQLNLCFTELCSWRSGGQCDFLPCLSYFFSVYVFHCLFLSLISNSCIFLLKASKLLNPEQRGGHTCNSWTHMITNMGLKRWLSL